MPGTVLDIGLETANARAADVHPLREASLRRRERR